MSREVTYQFAGHVRMSSVGTGSPSRSFVCYNYSLSCSQLHLRGRAHNDGLVNEAEVDFRQLRRAACSLAARLAPGLTAVAILAAIQAAVRMAAAIAEAAAAAASTGSIVQAGARQLSGGRVRR